MEKPYVKKIKEVSGYIAWYVDGQYIRTNIDEEFTNFGNHYSHQGKFRFIPEKDLWIDDEKTEGEADFYIADMLAYIKAFKEGKGYKKAAESADLAERKEREKSVLARTALKKANIKKDIAPAIYKKLLYHKGNMKIWVVDGEAVRDIFYIDFTEGGHDKVYKFVPHDEIWLDDDLSAKERKFVLLHEIHERNLMAKGMNYNNAHKDSSRIEFYARHHPKEIAKLLEDEFKIVED